MGKSSAVVGVSVSGVSVSVQELARLLAALDQAIASAEAIVPPQEPGALPPGVGSYRIPAKQWADLCSAIRQVAA